MYKDLVEHLPQEILDSLPYAFEDNEVDILMPLVEAYRELKRGHSAELFIYEAKDSVMQLDPKNYQAKLEAFKKICERVQPCITNDAKILIPRSPVEIAKELYTTLTYTTLSKEDITSTVKAVTGYSKAPDFEQEEHNLNALMIGSKKPD